MAKIGHPLTVKQLSEINRQFKQDFNTTLHAATAGFLDLPVGTILIRIQVDVAVAYGIRNHAAHDVAPVPTMWRQLAEGDPAGIQQEELDLTAQLL